VCLAGASQVTRDRRKGVQMEPDAPDFDRKPDDEEPPRDTGMIGSDAEEPGPGRDASLTDPDPVAASADQPRGTVGMSDQDPMRTRLGAHKEDSGVRRDVAAEEEEKEEEAD
jgi:hypothetical protein